MARPPILSLKDISLTFGGDPLFSGVDMSAGEGDRLCLVGRNGSGKSTLLKIVAGQVAHDSGDRFVQPGKHVAYLPQDPDLSDYATLLDYAAADVPDETYKAEMALEGLRLDGSLSTTTASGGEKRRAALARLLAAEPDLMLLDEPTNHLDITAIEWLEETLRATRTGYILISHDRALMAKVTTGTLWLDRGVVRRADRGFGGFEDWRDKIFEEEDAALHKLDQKIKREQHWIVHGVSGRRKRNVRRVGELAALREQRSTHLHRAGPAAMALESGNASGKLVIEAKGIAKGYDGRSLVADFSTKIMRGDRVAFVGPNGAGKTTLLKMLTGELTPDDGTVRHGANIALATLDQKRDLDGAKTLWETMTEDVILGRSICCRICWPITTARCCWSAMTAISSTASPPRPSRWRGMAARWNMRAATPITGRSAAVAVATPRRKPQSRKPRPRRQRHPPRRRNPPPQARKCRSSRPIASKTCPARWRVWRRKSPSSKRCLPTPTSMPATPIGSTRQHAR